MILLVMRHTHAVDAAPGIGDAGRWLTPKGRRVARKVARWLGKNDKRRPLSIWTSPLVRAVQTAEIVAAEVGFAGEVRAVAELSPGRDPGDLIKLFDEVVAPVHVVVGHEPMLSRLAHALIGDVDLGNFKKGGVLGLTWEGGRAEPRFFLDPAKMKAKKRFEAAPQPASTAAASDDDDEG